MVEIAYHLQRHPNSFLLHSVVVPGAAAKDANSEPSDWFTTRKKQVFIDSGIKVMFVGSPMLAQLVVSGSVEEVREVLEKSDPEWKAVDSVDSYGQTLLHSATAQRRPDLVQLLLEFDPDVEDQNRSGSSLLKAAAGGGEALRVSTERSETLKWGSVHEAASDHTEILRLLILKELMWARRQKTEPRPRR